jgi:tetratricopeptide (TPR) repeat protein
MLASVLPIADLIVAVDTGSVDDTASIIRRFAAETDTPVLLFERPFDDYGSSRNFALDRLLDAVTALGWDAADTWAFWMNGRDRMTVQPGFSKTGFTEDVYAISVAEEEVKYRRRCFFRLNTGFRWFAPVFETLTNDRPEVPWGLIDHLSIRTEEHDDKSSSYYLKKNERNSRLLRPLLKGGKVGVHWLFEAGQTFQRIGQLSRDNTERRDRYYNNARSCYQKVLLRATDLEYKFNAQLQLGILLERQEATPGEVQQAYLDAYSLNPDRGESIHHLIAYYASRKSWDQAYTYSKQAIELFYKRNPYTPDTLLVDESFYDWRIMDWHYYICMNMGNIEEANMSMTELKKVSREHPELLPKDKIEQISRY